MENEFDVLIVFAGQTTKASSLKSNIENDSTFFNCPGFTRGPEAKLKQKEMSMEAHLVEVDWCAYDVKKSSVLSELQNFIKPEGMVEYTQEAQELTGLSEDDFYKAITLKDFVSFFNDFCFFNFAKNNLSYCIVTFGDDLLTKQLPMEAKAQNIKLLSHFYSYFDVLQEFRRFYCPVSQMKSVKDMMHYLDLRDIPFDYPCQHVCKNSVRIINKLTRDGHKFHSPRVLNQQFKVVTHDQDMAEIPESRKAKKFSSFINGRAPEPFKNTTKCFYVRMRGLPYSTSKQTVLDFLRGIRVHGENLAFMHDLERKFVGDCYVKLISEDDFSLAKSLHKSQMKKRAIEIYESTENEYFKAQNSEGINGAYHQIGDSNGLASGIPKNAGIMKIRGLPLEFTQEDLLKLFIGIKVVENGVKMGVSGEKPSGEAFVIFENGEELQKGLRLEMQRTELSRSDSSEMEKFLQRNSINKSSRNGFSVESLPRMNNGKNSQRVRVSNLSLDTTKEEVLMILKDFKVDEHCIQMQMASEGGFNGSAIVSFSDELDAQKAMKDKHLSLHKKRFIELHLFES